MSREDGGSRADRLRRRRSTRPERTAGEPPEKGDPPQPSKPSQPDESSELSPSATASVKEEQIGTYMYLPESQKKEIERLYNVLKADYEYEFDEEFEKNRHYFPILIQHGIETLDGMAATDIRDLLAEFNL